MTPTSRQLSEAKLKVQSVKLKQWREERATRDAIESNDNNDSLDVSIVSPTDCPKALQGHNAFNKLSHWDTPKKKRSRKKPSDVYVSTTIASPASTIDSPIASAVRATNLPNSNEECE